jgi:predicted MFS family arabinose efflux permease
MLAAVPAKMMVTGFLFFLAPLVLSDLGVSESQIGRMTMIYGLSGLLLMPLFANLCDRLQIHGLMVGAGALISGIGLIPLLFGASVANVAVAILAIGVGQAMSISAQTAFITIVARAETAESGPGPVLGAFRFVERLGSAVGPLVAAQIALYYGYVTTAVVFGFAAITFGTLFSAFFLLMGVAPEADDDSFEAAMETPS